MSRNILCLTPLCKNSSSLFITKQEEGCEVMVERMEKTWRRVGKAGTGHVIARIQLRFEQAGVDFFSITQLSLSRWMAY